MDESFWCSKKFTDSISVCLFLNKFKDFALNEHIVELHKGGYEVFFIHPSAITLMMKKERED